MLNSIDTFDVPTRVRELELSIARRVRETLQPFIRDPETLETTAREVLLISRDYAGSFQAINNRDLIVVRDCVMLLAALVVAVNFIVDLVYVAIDPRLKAHQL